MLLEQSNGFTDRFGTEVFEWRRNHSGLAFLHSVAFGHNQKEILRFAQMTATSKCHLERSEGICFLCVFNHKQLPPLTGFSRALTMTEALSQQSAKQAVLGIIGRAPVRTALSYTASAM